MMRQAAATGALLLLLFVATIQGFVVPAPRQQQQQQQQQQPRRLTGALAFLSVGSDDEKCWARTLERGAACMLAQLVVIHTHTTLHQIKPTQAPSRPAAVGLGRRGGGCSSSSGLMWQVRSVWGGLEMLLALML